MVTLCLTDPQGTDALERTEVMWTQVLFLWQEEPRLNEVAMLSQKLVPCYLEIKQKFT